MDNVRAFLQRHLRFLRVLALCLTAITIILGVLWFLNPNGNYEPLIFVMGSLAALIGAPQLVDVLFPTANNPSNANELSNIVSEQLKLFFETSNIESEKFSTTDPVVDALYICESNGGSTLGFAANNSGLILCVSTVNSINSVKHLRSGKRYPATGVVKNGNLFQAITINQRTRGLVPAYLSGHELIKREEKIFMYNAKGEKVFLEITAFEMEMSIRSSAVVIDLKSGIEVASTSTKNVIGGPVINEALEVFGVAVGRSQYGNHIYIQPWLHIEDCTKTDANVKLQPLEEQSNVFQRLLRFLSLRHDAS
jgi:hypothetical protein